MSFTGTEIVTLANAFAVTESGNNNTLQLPFLNQVLRNYQRDTQSQDKTLDLTTVSTPALTTGVSAYVFTTIDAPDQTDEVAYRISSTSDWSFLRLGTLEDSMRYEQQSGMPEFYFWSRPNGVTTFNVYPKPSAAFVVAAATLRVRCKARQAELTAVSDTIYLDATAMSALAYDLAALFAMRDNRHDLAATLTAYAEREKNMNAEDALKVYGTLNGELNPHVAGGPDRGRWSF